MHFCSKYFGFCLIYNRCFIHRQEREERKREHERALRPNAFLMQQNSPNQSPSKAAHHGLKIKLEEMDVDDANMRQGTSPLLTSLLKSPSPAPNPGTSILNTITMGGNNQTRTSAPTITNLLTGSMSTAQQKTQTINVPYVAAVSAASPIYPHQFQTQPLTGPPSSDNNIGNIIQSPSQSAPTLSMLLENKNRDNKNAIQTHQDVQTKVELAAQDLDLSKAFVNDLIDGDANVTDSPIKDEDQQLMDVFNDLIPDNIEDILNPELLEGGEILDGVDDLMNDEEALQDVTDTKNLVNEIDADMQAEECFPLEESKNDKANEAPIEAAPPEPEIVDATRTVKVELIDTDIEVKVVSNECRTLFQLNVDF